MLTVRHVRLRPAILEERAMVLEWMLAPDVVPWLFLSGETPSLETLYDDWQEHYFTDESPQRGRVFVILSAETPVGAIAYNDIDGQNRVELDIWLNSESYCNRGIGPDAVDTLCRYLKAEFGVSTFMMQPSARNPRAIRAYEKAGFIVTPSTPETIAANWGSVDHPDSVLMIRRVV